MTSSYSTLSEAAAALQQIKTDIKAVIESRGIAVGNDGFDTYASKIMNIMGDTYTVYARNALGYTPQLNEPIALSAGEQSIEIINELASNDIHGYNPEDAFILPIKVNPNKVMLNKNSSYNKSEVDVNTKTYVDSDMPSLDTNECAFTGSCYNKINSRFNTNASSANAINTATHQGYVNFIPNGYKQLDNALYLYNPFTNEYGTKLYEGNLLSGYTVQFVIKLNNEYYFKRTSSNNFYRASDGEEITFDYYEQDLVSRFNLIGTLNDHTFILRRKSSTSLTISEFFINNNVIGVNDTLITSYSSLAQYNQDTRLLCVSSDIPRLYRYYDGAFHEERIGLTPDFMIPNNIKYNCSMSYDGNFLLVKKSVDNQIKSYIVRRNITNVGYIAYEHKATNYNESVVTGYFTGNVRPSDGYLEIRSDVPGPKVDEIITTTVVSEDNNAETSAEQGDIL